MPTQQITCFHCNFFSVGISALNFQKSLKRKIKFAETYCCNQGIKDLIERSLGGARAKKKQHSYSLYNKRAIRKPKTHLYIGQK